ncbi:MAG: hypothetical protein AAGD25_06700 [Cyanobacteria bacterium P01_F01_bin.150]
MNTTAIARHLNVVESAIKEIRDFWTWTGGRVLLVIVKGLGTRFVSKKVVKEEVSGKDFLSRFISKWNSSQGTEWNSMAGGFVKARLWDKKEGELRIYFTRIDTPLIMKGIKGKFGFTSVPKKYKVNELIVPILTEMGASLKITSLKGKVLMQEDEDGIIAPEGQHEPGVHITREWYA